MKNQQRQFDETQRKNSMIRVKTKGSVKPRIKTNRIPLPKISQLIASCLIQKYGYDPTIKGRRKAFIEDHLAEIKDIHRLNYTPEKGYALDDATFFRTWNDYISGRQVPDGKSLYAFAHWLGLDPDTFKQKVIQEMKEIYDPVDLDAWLASDSRHGGYNSNRLSNLFVQDAEDSTDIIKIYCIKNKGKGKTIIEKIDKLLSEDI